MITIYKNIRETKDCHYLTVEQALERIKNGRSKAHIYLLRGLKDKKERSKKKAELPSVCFSGKFSERKDDCLIEHSGYVILDFDDLKKVNEKKSEIIKDEIIYACWISPSGNGLKALVKIPKEPENHESYYLSLIDKYPELDTTSKNLSRVCYESFDPEIYINENSKIWDLKKVEQQQPEKKAVQPKKQNTTKKTNYSKVEQVLNVIRRAVDGTKHENLLKASKLAGGFIATGLVDEYEISNLLTQEVGFMGADDIELAKKTIQDGISYGKMLPISDVIENHNDFSFISEPEKEKEWLELARKNKIPQGYDIGSEHFDNHFRLKPRTLVGIFGIDNVGKTTFHNFISVCYSKKHKVNWLIVCRENENASIRQNLIELYNGRPLHEQTDEEYKEAFDFCYKYFDLIDNSFDIDIDNFFKIIEKAYSKKHYFATFVDPYNAIQFEQTPNKNYDFLGRLRKFQNDFNMSFHVSMHISTEKARNYIYSEKETLFDFNGREIALKGQFKIPRKNFVEGGQPIANKLDDIIIVHRIAKMEELKSYTLVSVDKVKEYKTGGMQSTDVPIMFLKVGFFNTFIDSKFKNPLATTVETVEQIQPNKEFDKLEQEEIEELYRNKDNCPF